MPRPHAGADAKQGAGGGTNRLPVVRFGQRRPRLIVVPRREDGYMSEVRRPKGAECQCVVCGLFFTGESAFNKHLLRLRDGGGCKPPAETGLVRRDRKAGECWGLPGERPGVVA